MVGNFKKNSTGFATSYLRALLLAYMGYKTNDSNDVGMWKPFGCQVTLAGLQIHVLTSPLIKRFATHYYWPITRV